MPDPYLEFDLGKEVEQLRREPDSGTGRKAKTLLNDSDLRIVLMLMRVDTRIPAHRAPGRIAIQTIEGQITVKAEGRTFALPVGGLLTLERGVSHDVAAAMDSAFLLTIVLPGPTA